MKSTTVARLLRELLVLPLACAALAAAHAQTYPAKPVRMIVPFAPGGNTDIIARILVPEMSKALGQQIIIENRGGAGSMIGTEAAAKSPPDGYTLLMVSAAHVINPAMVKSLPFDPVRSFAAISKVADVPSALVVHPSLPVKTVKDLLTLARARPGQLNYGSAGRGSIGHLSAELLGSLAKVKMTHVPYKGAGPAVQDTMAGHTQMAIQDLGSVGPFVASGKLVALAVTGPKRWPLMPDLPTFAELGYPLDIAGWNGIMAPTGTPRPVVDRMSAEINRIIQSPEGREQMLKFGLLATGTSPEEFAEVIRKDTPRWGEVIRKAGIKAQ